MHSVDVALGNPTNTAYIPNLTTGFGPNMTLFQRVVNTVLTYGTQFYAVISCRIF